MKQKYEVAEDNILEESYVTNDIKDEREQLLKVVMEGRRNEEDGAQKFDEFLEGCRERAELPDGIEISFHWLKENTGEEDVLIDSIAIHNKDEEDKGRSNSESVVQQRRKALKIFYTSDQVEVEIKKGIQTEMFQKGSILDKEIDELWHLMQRCKKNNDSEVQIVNLMTIEDCEDHYRITVQHQLSVQIYISKTYDDLQTKVWDPGGFNTIVT